MERIKTEVSMGEHVLARKCCREFFPHTMDSGNETAAFEESIERAILFLPGGNPQTPQTVGAGTISIFNPHKPNLERRLEVQGILGAADVMKTCMYFRQSVLCAPFSSHPPLSN